MKIRSLFVVLMTACMLVMSAQAADRATPDDAKAMAVKAAKYLEDLNRKSAGTNVKK